MFVLVFAPLSPSWLPFAFALKLTRLFIRTAYGGAMTKAFDKIMAGLEDAIAYANGDTSRAVTRTFIDGKWVVTPPGKKPPRKPTLR